MRICIYANLEKGGALDQIENISKLIRKKHTVDFYCHKNNFNKKNFTKSYIYPLNSDTKLINNKITRIIKIKENQKKIAQEIKIKKYDLTFVFPCIETQTPFIIRYLDKERTIYFFTETKREYHEKTSYNHNNIKLTLLRILSLSIKYIDIQNCKKAKYIISNSIYSKYILNKIYNKYSYVIYPGLTNTKTKMVLISKPYKIISIGQHNYTKGHDLSISNTPIKISILGRKSHDTDILYKINKNNINFIYTEKDTEKKQIIKKHNIFLVNYRNEPFGISTLEGTSYKLYCLGLNSGGTGEIIRHGINGFIYPEKNIKKTTKHILNYNKLSFNCTTKINWHQYVETLYKIIDYKILNIND